MNPWLPLIGLALIGLWAAARPARGADGDSTALVEAWLMAENPARALEEARAAIAAPGADWEAHLAYMEAAAQAGHGWAVVAEYRWLGAREPALGPLVAWAEVQAARGPDLDPALARLGRLVVEPHDPTDRLAGRALVRLGRGQEALTHLEGARTPAERRAYVEALIAAGRPLEAAAEVQEGLQALPRHPEIALSLFAPGGEPDRAVRRARHAAVAAAEGLLECDEPAALFHAWLVLAWAREREGAARAAGSLSRRVPGLTLPPRLPYGAAMVRSLGEGQVQTGQRGVPPALTPAESAAVAHVRAQVLRDGGRPQEALAAFGQAVELDPGDPELALEAAEVAAELDPAQAITWIRLSAAAVARASDLPPGRQRALLARGLELGARITPEADEALVQRLLASLLEPSAESLFALALAQEAAGAAQPAIESLARAAAAGSEPAAERLDARYPGPASPDALLEAARATPERASAFERPRSAGPAARHLTIPLSTTSGDLTLEAWQGQVVVLVFWASWCKPCAHELPLLAEQGAAWAEESLPVRILAVCVDEDQDGWSRGLARFGGLGIDLAWSRDLAAALDVRAVPATQVLGRAGLPAGRLQGFEPGQAEQLDRLVRGLLPP